MTTRRVVITAIVAALYAVMTIALNPISFGPIQLRAANLLMALMFFDKDYCYGLALGVFIGNLTSPFGALDWGIMPMITLIGALSGYAIRKYWYVGLITWALITSAGVSFFPLGLGAQLPFLATFPMILIAQLIVGFGGYAMFIPFRKTLEPI
jgi:uncharacterized membrane protein